MTTKNDEIEYPPDYLSRTDLETVTVRLPPIIIERLRASQKKWQWRTFDEEVLYHLRVSLTH